MVDFFQMHNSEKNVKDNKDCIKRVLLSINSGLLANIQRWVSVTVRYPHTRDNIFKINSNSYQNLILESCP